MSRLRGKIRMYDERRGFGFIRPDGGGGGDVDVFVHATQIAADADKIAKGREVEFELGTNPRDGRSLAKNVTLVGA